MSKLSAVLVGAAVIFLALPVSAQINVGLIGGLNLANLSVDPDPGIDLNNRTAFGFGGVLDFTLSDMLALHLEPMYLQKGSKLESGGQEAKIKADYLEIPVMFKYAFGNSTAKPYVMAGPSIGILLSNKVTNGGEVDIKDETKSTDFGVGFGAGVSFPAGSSSIFIEGRYTLGLTNVNDDPNDPDTDIKTKGIQFFGGVTFPLGGK
jgi:opacity protein-like surface antigen